MTRRTPHAVGLLGILGAMCLLGGCVLWTVGLGARDDVDADSELVFSHDRHGKMDIECAECHDVATAVSHDDLIPREADCMPCHSREQGCELCHGNANLVQPRPADFRDLRLKHATHIKPDVNPDGCARCHPDVSRSERVTDSYSVPQRVCSECHSDDMGSADRCGYCHDQMGTTAFLPVSHNASWLTEHASATKGEDDLCEVCHRGSVRADFVRGPATPEFVITSDHAQTAQVDACADCHLGDVWPDAVHDDNYLQHHSIDASLTTSTCESCHQRDECMACHIETGVQFADIHPAGFIFDHGSEARMRLETCAVCHEESTCIECHSEVSPHPDGFEAESSSMNAALCGKCHTGGELG